MKLTGKKLTTAVLTGLMGATMVSGAFAADNTETRLTNVEILATQNKGNIDSLQQDVNDLKNSAAKDTYSKDEIDSKLTDKANQSDVTTNTTNITKNASAIADNKTAIDKNASAITDNKTAIADNKTAIDKNASAIADNKTAIADNKTAIDAVQKDYTTVKDTVDFIKKNKDAIDNVGSMRTQLDTTTAVADNNHKNITQEIQDRKDADQALQNKINDEATLRDQAIANERAERKGADAAQDKVIQAVNDNLVTSVNTINKNMADGFNKLSEVDQAEAATRDKADKQLQTNIDKEAATRDKADKQLQTNIDNEATTRENADKAEAAARDKADKQLQTNIDNEATTRENADKAEAATRDKADKQLQTNIDNEATTRENADKAEAATRDKADKQLQTNINNEATTRENADKAEAATRDKADKQLQTNIGNEATTRETADKTLQDNIDKEATARETADKTLQNQINNNSTSINDLYGRYSSLKTDINKVGARSAALAGLHPLDFDPANKLNFAVASGSFKGENSVALGAFYRPNENIMFSAASTMGDSNNAYTFGLSFKIGRSSAKTKTTSPDAEELYKVVGQLQDQLAAQQKEIEQLKADKAK